MFFFGTLHFSEYNMLALENGQQHCLDFNILFVANGTNMQKHWYDSMSGANVLEIQSSSILIIPSKCLKDANNSTVKTKINSSLSKSQQYLRFSCYWSEFKVSWGEPRSGWTHLYSVIFLIRQQSVTVTQIFSESKQNASTFTAGVLVVQKVVSFTESVHSHWPAESLKVAVTVKMHLIKQNIHLQIQTHFTITEHWSPVAYMHFHKE